MIINDLIYPGYIAPASLKRQEPGCLLGSER